MSLDRVQATLALDEPVTRVHQVSPARAKILEKFDIRTVRDLLAHYPRTYLDMSDVEPIAQASIGQCYTICATVHEMKLKRPRRNLSLVEMTLVDATGVLIVTVFRNPRIMDRIQVGMTVAVSGKVSFDWGYKRMTNPFIEVVEEGQRVDGAIVPLHAATEKLSAAWMRRIISNGLDLVEGAFDPLPLEYRLHYRLMSRSAALRAIHFPSSMNEMHQARRRLVYEELFLLELFLMQQTQARAKDVAPVEHVTNGPHVRALQNALSFTLTSEQSGALSEIFHVMAAPRVANHMLLGDVGTGKTILAGFAIAAAADSGGQAMLLAPTEVLARQHASTLGAFLEKAQVSCALLTGSTPVSERSEIVRRFSAGELDVLIGTHALLSDDVVAARLTLVVVDEQQRFGVEQRAQILSKGQAPDALYLTATPIPRTLALALYGNLSLSYLRGRPCGEVKRETKVLSKRDQGFAFDAALSALRRGEQVYVVCPLVGGEAEEGAESSASNNRFDQSDGEYHPVVSIENEQDFHDDPASALKLAALLRDTTFSGYTVEVLHGGMSGEAKREVMERFSQGSINVLVATTVVEVGVDVANATVMIVQDADRFGLSQLHQLRGRVGRGGKASEVYLVSASKRPEALARLKALEDTDDGFELASYDLSLRREGDILGNRQHGASSLKLVQVTRDGAVIEAAREDAWALLESDPSLEDPDHRALAREIRVAFGDSAAFAGG